MNDNGMGCMRLRWTEHAELHRGLPALNCNVAIAASVQSASPKPLSKWDKNWRNMICGMRYGENARLHQRTPTWNYPRFGRCLVCVVLTVAVVFFIIIIYLSALVVLRNGP